MACLSVQYWWQESCIGLHDQSSGTANYAMRANSGPKRTHPLPKTRFRGNLLAWFDQNKRALPWRRDRDPYRIWISEIMLQQTRVAAVLDHYRRFLQRFPTVQKLAAARESSVLAVWSGLGYYRRARMLHAAAREIVNQGGQFPENAAGLLQLPGIGRYTAAAVASIAFDESSAVVDGNVERVLKRVSGKKVAGEARWQLANQLLDPERPGDFNQAMMELGATVCLPRQPKCLICPIFEICRTRGESRNAGNGTRQKKKQVCYALSHRNGAIFLVQRPPTATLMPSMWELPEVTPSIRKARAYLTLRHSITVTDYTVQVIKAAAPKGIAGRWVPKSRLSKLPLTGLTRKILRAAQVI
jgi:A/G-specific adenine glycosylase